MDPQSQTPQTQPVQPLQQPTSPVPAKKPSAKMLLLVLGFVIILIAIGTAYVLGARL
jgi:LPS O-antigen subunit length determinant protein (WzzB/FepE family)